MFYLYVVRNETYKKKLYKSFSFASFVEAFLCCSLFSKEIKMQRNNIKIIIKKQEEGRVCECIEGKTTIL